MIISKTHDNLISMKRDIHMYPSLQKVADIIDFYSRLSFEQRKVITCFFNKLRMPSYNLFTSFPQNLWKTSHDRAIFRFASLLICCTVLVSSCSFFKSTKKDAKPAPDTVAVAQETKPVQENKPAAPAGGKKKGFFSFFTADEKKPFLDNSLIDQGRMK